MWQCGFVWQWKNGFGKRWRIGRMIVDPICRAAARSEIIMLSAMRRSSGSFGAAKPFGKGWLQSADLLIELLGDPAISSWGVGYEDNRNMPNSAARCWTRIRRRPVSLHH
jgi:hypothetical protein